MIAEELIVRVRAEVAEAVRDLKRLEGQSNKSAGGMQSLVRNAMTLGKVTAAIVFVKKAAQALIALGDSASAAEETLSRFNSVFRDIGPEANAAMQNVAESFGLAESTAASLVGATGDILTGFGLSQQAALDLSVQTTRLASDLASFSNAAGGAEAVSSALTSAYTGNTDALRSYGVVITQAMVQTRILENEQNGLTFATEQQARAQATLDLALEQSANAIGDYERTSDSAANVSRRLGQEVITLRENLGDLALRAITPARRALTGFVETINDAFEEETDQSRALDRWRARIEVLQGELEILDRRQHNATEAMASARRAADQYGMTLDELAESTPGWSDQIEGARATLERFEPAVSSANDEIARLRNLIERVTNPTIRVEDDIDGLSDALARFAEVNREMAGMSQERFLDSLSAEARAVAELEEQLNDLVAVRSGFRDEGIDTSGSALQRFINEITHDLSVARAELANAEKGVESFAGMATDKMKAAEFAAEAAMEAMRDAARQTRDSFNSMTEGPVERIQRMTDEFRSAGVDMADVAMWSAAQMAQHYVQVAQTIFTSLSGAFSSIGTMLSSFTDQHIAEMERQKEATESRYSAEIEWAEAAGATDEEIAELKRSQAEESEKAEAEIAKKQAALALRQFRMDKAMQIGQATMAGATAAVQVLPNVPLSIAIGSLAATQIAAIAATKPPAFEQGGSFVTSGPQMIMVGDGQSPRERVTVEPLSGPYRGSAGGGVNVTINGVVGSREEVASWVWDAIRKGQQRGAIRA